MHATLSAKLQFLRGQPKDCAIFAKNRGESAVGRLVCRLQQWDNQGYGRAVVRPIAANVLSTADVRSPAGENVGKIVDFMLDTEQGSVVYAVLAVGGVLGVGAKMLAIPPRDLRLDDRRCLELAVDTATLDAAPGIDRTNPPETADALTRSEQRPHTPTRG